MRVSLDGMRTLALFSLLATLSGCYCVTSQHVRLSEAPGLRITGMVDTSNWRRLRGVPDSVPISYEYRDSAVRIFLKAPVLAAGTPALWVDSVLAYSGAHVRLTGDHLHPAHPGTDLAYYLDVTNDSSQVLRLTVLNDEGHPVDSLSLPFRVQPHSRTCGIEWL